MIDSNFINKDSFLNGIDPRVRVIFTFCYALTVALLKDVNAVYISLFLPFLLIFTKHIKYFDLFKRLTVVNGFIVLLWFFLPLSFPGETLYQFKALSFSREGFEYAYLITLKSNAIVITTIFLLGISSFIEIAHALDHLHISKKLIFMLYFCYRYIQDISWQYKKLTDSLKIKGFIPGTNIKTYKTYAYLVGILLVKSYDRAQRVIKAMTCRGFDGTFYTLNHFHYKTSDIVYSSAGVAYLLLIIGASVWNHL